MKKLFEKPEIEIVSLNSVCDVITTSPPKQDEIDVGTPGSGNPEVDVTNL